MHPVQRHASPGDITQLPFSRGHPIFYFHGLPGSRLEGALWHQPAADLGAKIIAIDRPGIGYSSPQSARTLLSFAQDIRDLAKQLDVSRYIIIGTSAGGPHALACAHAHEPTALAAVALVAGLGPYEMVSSHAKLANRIVFWLFKHPWLAKPLGRISAAQFLRNPKLSDDELLDAIEKKLDSSRFRLGRKLPEQDKQVVRDREIMRLVLASARQHFRQGMDGWAPDGKLLTEELGFRLDELRVPMRLWYGRHDVNVPLSMGEELARRIGERAQLRVEDQGHVSILMNCREKVLRDLLSLA
ncbi:Uu.00g063300.m01.CDS01 [Anthostomella pinea]|uniref:Uu.00g063300.m01.CDS01 n=1 Tax=Anthostomella pinea TaxID=933095 RepID=A0AAI8VTY8_9PEZI|nr:Uu.00g063300.m01.CDS01 [Anthostomella pinea]